MLDWRDFVYGGIASIVAECGTFPIDLTKTRLQIQGQKIDCKHTQLRYRGMLHAMYKIYSEEGIQALYSGVSPALLRQATYGTLKIGIYWTLKKAIHEEPDHETLLTNTFCGVIAGAVGNSITNPTDVLKVRMQAKGKESAKIGIVQSFRDIYTQEGFRGLYRGVCPTAQRAGVIAGVELPIYDISKKYIILHGYLGDTKITHFLSSFIAGFFGAVASNPIDVVKTRLMNQKKLKDTVAGSSKQIIYAGSVDCFVQTVKTEGFMALYKGFIPTWVRLGPWNIIFFMTLEHLKQLY